MAKVVTPEQALRNARRKIEITDKTICFSCKSKGLKTEDYYCPNCRFPQGGTTKEQAEFLNKVVKKKRVLRTNNDKISHARNILYFFSILNIAVGVILGLLIQVNLEVLIGGIIGSLIYFGFAKWSIKKPFPAILSGFFTYIVFNVIGAIADPSTIFQGIILKVVFISIFIYGIRAVKVAERIQKDLEFVNKSKDLTENETVS